ncbi:hypothetical protein VSDG_08681 [Cytospora chrysosperma]|uniref:NAD-dependent epimerase/dehydratase domain-containing protein n=1 Tax=Cytospora chrysosperma TaxID=252740 RepID=A0A423VEK7_CYTCH|nr:hypothetical protein VSDG_08681 [Valsa sordida]
MPSPNLLITGVTGFIGFKVLLDALEAGYAVRAAVRSASQSESLRSHPKVKDVAQDGKLEFVEVPDLLVPGAYDEALKGVTYAIHLAAPLPSPALDPQTGIYEPALKSTVNMLKSAAKATSLKKLVITSSVFETALSPPDPSVEVTAVTRQPDLPGPFNDTLSAYIAGKIAALNATDRFIKEHKPSFALVNIMPGFVFGKDDKALTVKDISTGTNRVLLPVVTGKSKPHPMPAGAAHVYDVAKVHLLALKDGVVGDFGVTKEHVFNDAWDVVLKHFPKAVEAGTFRKGGSANLPSKVECSCNGGILWVQLENV